MTRQGISAPLPPDEAAADGHERERRSLFMWLWRGYLAKHWRLLLVAMLFMAIEGSMLGLLAWLIQPMFDLVFVSDDMRLLWVMGFVVMGVFFVRAATSVIHRVILTRISQLSLADLRRDLLAHLMTLDSTYHQVHAPGYLIERVQGDVAAVGSVWRAVITGVGRDAVSVVLLFGVAMSIDWRWTLLALVGVPILVMPTVVAQRFVRRRSRRAREVAARMSTRLDEVFHGINPIKLNRLEDYQSQRYDRLTEKRVKTEIEASFGGAMVPALIDVMTGIGFLGVVVYGGSEIVSGDKTVGEFMSFFAALAFAFEPLRRLGQIASVWQNAAASIERMLEIFETRPTISVPARPAALPAGPLDIELDGVTFAYEDLPVLDGASFTARAGETTALVGASGAGKSTVFNVLTRLVEPQAGRVTIGGVPVETLDLGELRGLFSVVSQDAALFDETLRENILLGREDVDEARLRRVLDAAHVADFLPNLPSGLDSPAGPRGSNLSGGQRQRVAIARALLRDTPILLLDEATSALDAESEAVVQAALDQLAHGRTTLVIAHRLSTVQGADKIVVLDRGRVVEEGRHEALLAANGRYADLYRLQFSGAEARRPAPV